MVVSLCLLHVCLSVCAVTPELFDLQPSYLALGATLTFARLALNVNLVDQRSKSNA